MMRIFIHFEEKQLILHRNELEKKSVIASKQIFVAVDRLPLKFTAILFAMISVSIKLISDTIL
jgi:hypothetical protein